MKKNLRIGFVISFFCMAFHTNGWSTPDFPPRDHGPIQAIKQNAEESSLPKENMTPESASTNKISEVTISEVHITVLSGFNQNGKKSYKADYHVIEVLKGDDSKQTQPTVKVSFKDKKDKLKFTVDDVEIKKTKSNTYKITANISELKSGESSSEPKVHLEN